MSRAAWIRQSTRLAIYFRDCFRCVYCRACVTDGKSQLTLDHVNSAGSNAASNLVTACYDCNSTRRDRSMVLWYRALRAKGINTKLVRLRIHRALKTPINRDLGAFAAELLQYTAAAGYALPTFAVCRPRRRC